MPDVELLIEMNKTDVLPSWAPPSCREDKNLMGNCQHAEWYTWIPYLGERRNHTHCSNQKNTAISLEISLFKFNSRRRSTAVPFPNWNSPPMCFWEAQMPWRFPSDNNRDCSQLWMILIDFSSNKNHESFHNFWNCEEITNTLAPEKKKNGHIMKHKVV